MKKKILLFAIFLASFTYVSAQTKIGLKISPLLSVNRAAVDENNLNIGSDGAGFKMSVGPVVDFYLKENYYFSTGLFYTPKRAGISINDNGITKEEEYNLQYLQVPATIKLFTNELALDKRLYFQLGGVTEIKIHEKNEGADNYIEKFRFFDFSVMAGFGLEYRIGVSSTIFGGISYTRGLINAASKRKNDYDFSVKNDLVSLDFGIMF